jgi:hypothetical protein
MPVFDIQIKDTCGREVGWKIVTAKSAQHIRSHPQLHVGPGRAIGKIVATDFRDSASAMEDISRDEGWKVITDAAGSRHRVPRSVFDV